MDLHVSQVTPIPIHSHNQPTPSRTSRVCWTAIRFTARTENFRKRPTLGCSNEATDNEHRLPLDPRLCQYTIRQARRPHHFSRLVQVTDDDDGQTALPLCSPGRRTTRRRRQTYPRRRRPRQAADKRNNEAMRDAGRRRGRATGTTTTRGPTTNDRRRRPTGGT